MSVDNQESDVSSIILRYSVLGTQDTGLKAAYPSEPACYPTQILVTCCMAVGGAGVGLDNRGE